MSTPSVHFFNSLGVVPQEPYNFFLLPLCDYRLSDSYIFQVSTTLFLKSSGITPGQLSGSTTGSTARESSFFSVGVIYQIYIFCQFYSQCNILASLGVLPQILYHFCGSTRSKVVEYLWDHFQTVKKQTLGVFLP